MMKLNLQYATTSTKQKNSHPGRPKLKKNENERVDDEDEGDNNDKVISKICNMMNANASKALTVRRKKDDLDHVVLKIY